MPDIDPRVVQLLNEMVSSPAMQRMATIDEKAKEIGLGEEVKADFVTALSRLVMSNIGKEADLRKFVDYVFETAVAAAPEIAAIIKKNATVLQKTKDGDSK